MTSSVTSACPCATEGHHWGSEVMARMSLGASQQNWPCPSHAPVPTALSPSLSVPCTRKVRPMGKRLAGAGSGPRSAGPAARSSRPPAPSRATCQTLSAVPPPGAEAVTGTGSGVLCLFGRRGSCRLLPGVMPRGSAGSSSRSHRTTDPSASQPRVRVSRVLTSFAAGGRHCRDGLSDGAEAAAGPTSGGAQRPREPATRPQRLGLGAPGPVPGCAQDAW